MRKALVVAGFMALAGCAGEVSEVGQSTAELSGDIVAIPRELSAAQKQGIAQQGLSGDNTETFYVAIKRSELSQKYFLTAYLKQLYPLFDPPAYSLGVKVVTFELQNNRLVVFDVDDRKKSSPTFDPDVVLESYPVVFDSTRFNSAPNATQYVLFDPAAGLNRFGVASQGLSQGSTFGGKFTTDVQYSDRFRALSDGVQYDQVFGGHFDQAPPPFLTDGVQQNQFLLNGTISVALRKYNVTPNFTSAPFENFYFPSSPRALTNQTGTEQSSARWAIRPGMTPIKWTISSRINALANDPRYAKYDIKKAVKDGIENWNTAFGYRVLTAVIGTDAVESGDDDKNVLVIDENPTFGFAFADWRSNPNNGEIRGASVYFNSGWLDYAAMLFDQDTQTPAQLAATTARIKNARKFHDVQIVWNGMTKKNDLRRIGGDPRSNQAVDLTAQLKADRAFAASLSAASPVALTPKQKVENFITHVVTHEIGHTLSLRHNFEGSLMPLSSSVMDYVYDPDAVSVPVPQAYDIAAIKYLYGQSTAAPTQPFCTDEEVGASTPDCAPFDRGAHPLTDYYGPRYTAGLTSYLADDTDIFSLVDALVYLGGVLDYVRAAETPAERLTAWNLAVTKVKPNLPASTTASAAKTAELFDREIWGQLYLGTSWFTGTPAFSSYSTPVPDDAALTTVRVAHLKNVLLNSDTFRAPESRRQSVDVLKAFQSLEAYRALTDARAALVTQRSTATGDNALVLTDLIARANAAMNPYFIK